MSIQSFNWLRVRINRPSSSEKRSNLSLKRVRNAQVRMMASKQRSFKQGKLS
jgi:hypothetical protein